MLNQQTLVPSLFADTPTKEVNWDRTSGDFVQGVSWLFRSLHFSVRARALNK